MLRECFMGQGNPTITVVNRLDEVLHESGRLAVEQIRQVALGGVEVKPQAMLFGLPADKIEELGLALLRTLPHERDNPTRIFQDAKVFFFGRVGIFQCLELPQGAHPMIGNIPMTELGLELDVQTQTVSLLPEPYLSI